MPLTQEDVDQLGGYQGPSSQAASQPADPNAGTLSDLEDRAQSSPQILGRVLQNQQQQLSSAQNQVSSLQTQLNDPYETIKRNLAQQYQNLTPRPASGGPIRRLLQNFLQGGGEALMHSAGVVTPQQQQQQTLQNMVSVQNSQTLNEMRQADTAYKQQSLDNLRRQTEAMEQFPMPAQFAQSIGHPELAGTPMSQKDIPGYIARYQQGAAQQKVAETNALSKMLAGQDKPSEIQLIQRANQGDPEAQATLDTLNKNRMALAKERGMGYALGRAIYTPFETVIPGTNIPTTISNMEALKRGAPKISIAAQGKLGGQYALYNDAYGILDTIDRLTYKVNLDDPGVAQRVAAGYAAIKDPASTGLPGEILSTILARQPINAELSDSERDLVLTMAQGKAAGTGLRSLIGQAGTNEMQQRLDSALFPGGTTLASIQSVRQQTAATRKFLDRFSVGLPKAGLNAPGTETALGNKGTPGTKMKVTKEFRTTAGKVYSVGDTIMVKATDLPKLKGYVTSAGR